MRAPQSSILPIRRGADRRFEQLYENREIQTQKPIMLTRTTIMRMWMRADRTSLRTVRTSCAQFSAIQSTRQRFAEHSARTARVRTARDAGSFTKFLSLISAPWCRGRATGVRDLIRRSRSRRSRLCPAPQSRGSLATVPPPRGTTWRGSARERVGPEAVGPPGRYTPAATAALTAARAVMVSKCSMSTGCYNR